jgi:hypothetical protein
MLKKTFIFPFETNVFFFSSLPVSLIVLAITDLTNVQVSCLQHNDRGSFKYIYIYNFTFRNDLGFCKTSDFLNW